MRGLIVIMWKRLLKFRNLLILLTVLLLISNGASYAEKLPRNLVEFFSGGPETYVPYRQYFAEYTDRLSQAFEPKGKFPWRTFIFTDLRYLIHKDGSISDLEIIDSSTESYEDYISKYNPIGRYRAKKASPKLDKYAMEVIMNNPPKPFLDGMDYESIRVEVQMCFYPRKRETYYMINAGGTEDRLKNIFVLPQFTIYLCRDSRKIKGD